MKAKEHRESRLTVRLTKNEAEHIRQQASATGVTPSEWVRAAALGRHIRTTADLEVLNELRRQGGLIKHLFNNGMDADATRAALSTLEEVAARLIRRE